VQASLTGHLVFSTLHTNDAPGAVTRLVDMGVEPYLVASSLEAVLAQRLVRVLCRSASSRITRRRRRP
jgi:type II secretory ATPase GspE/PulE/Tfp pilus assembly ATPase PilB-like protein